MPGLTGNGKIPPMSEWPELQSLWEMNWGEPRGTETVRVIEHHVPMLAVCVSRPETV